MTQTDSKPKFRDDSKEHILFGKDVSDQFTDDLENRVAQKKKQTVKKIRAVKLKEIDKYQRISNIQRSGYTDPTRPCCVSMQTAHVRMMTGAKKGTEDLYDADGQLKDAGKWDYRAAL